MSDGYELLIEKEEMWARMLGEVLEDNGIPCVLRGVNGVGFSLHTGIQDRVKVFVPKEYIERASKLVKELFSDESKDPGAGV